MSSPLARDLDDIVEATAPLWAEMRGARLFLTGGTGFFGCWLIESFVRANDQLGLQASVLVLTRNAAAFAAKAPHLARHPSVHVHEGDVRSFAFPAGACSHVIHGAVDARLQSRVDDPAAMFEILVRGTERTLQFAAACGARQVLLLSSGAVYGRQPADMTHMPETYAGGPDPCDPRAALGEGKRAAEMLCALRASDLAPKIARCFAFVGPYQPLDGHYAAPNFIRDAIAGGPIRITGDGTPVRSYLYAADLTVWLWTILFRGAAMRPYNVGSEDGTSIHGLAQAVSKACEPPTTIAIARSADPTQPVERYVPSTARARNELNLRVSVPLDEAIRRTMAWQRGVVPSS
jgi:dTDP-glucose 4,6-dehydratase